MGWIEQIPTSHRQAVVPCTGKKPTNVNKKWTRRPHATLVQQLVGKKEPWNLSETKTDTTQRTHSHHHQTQLTPELTPSHFLLLKDTNKCTFISYLYVDIGGRRKYGVDNMSFSQPKKRLVEMYCVRKLTRTPGCRTRKKKKRERKQVESKAPE